MSIRIDRDLCVGCGACTEVCPGNLIEVSDPAAPRNLAGFPTAQITRPRDCWGCVSCVKACPAGAISLFLGADLGGRGSTLTVERRGDLLDWNIDRFDGERITVSVDTRQSNKY